MPIVDSNGTEYKDEIEFFNKNPNLTFTAPNILQDFRQPEEPKINNTEFNLGTDIYVPEKDPVKAQQFVSKLKETWPVKVVEGMVDALTLPGDVYSGKADLNTQEGLDRVFNMATNIGLAGLSAASAKPGLGMLGGDVGKAAAESWRYIDTSVDHKPIIKDTTVLLFDQFQKSTNDLDKMVAELDAKLKANREANVKSANWYEGDTALEKPFTEEEINLQKGLAKLSAISYTFQDKVSEIADHYIAKWMSITASTKFDKHIVPVDFNNYISSGKHATPNAMVDPSEIGFNTSLPLYKGKTGAALANKFEGLPDPLNKEYEKGIFFADSPHVAAQYGPVEKFLARPLKTAEINWYTATGKTGYDSPEMSAIIDRARAKDYDLLVVKNIRDYGGMQNQYVVLNPSIIRSNEAKFNPTRLGYNELLASLATAGYLTPEAINMLKTTKEE